MYIVNDAYWLDDTEPFFFFFFFKKKGVDKQKRPNTKHPKETNHNRYTQETTPKRKPGHLHGNDH